MKKKFLVFVNIAIISALLAACTAAVEPSEAYKDETPQQIYQRGKEALQDNSYSEAIKRFEALDIQYPFGTETENAQFYLVYAYYIKDEYAMAVAAANRFIRLHPTHPQVDYIYYIRGLADFYQNMGVIERLFSVDLATRDLTQMQKSYNDFSELVSRFINSRYTPPAHQYMLYLRNMMATHELQVAQYYYGRGVYIAAANRASDVVMHYQGAPAVIAALKLMAKSYHQLGMTKLEQDVLSVLRYNYPDYKNQPLNPFVIG
ncbi:MAG TPA: outer membrane protein assembly factor BamD [Gammaproteobacteria bacterium]|nr:outer membrane protein assembly factor BamD [Gammaproteobacteria bacterium]